MLNPDAPAPTRAQRVATAVGRTLAIYSPVVLVILGIVIGFVLSRL